jgi:hypothetical protein
MGKEECQQVRNGISLSEFWPLQEATHPKVCQQQRAYSVAEISDRNQWNCSVYNDFASQIAY